MLLRPWKQTPRHLVRKGRVDSEPAPNPKEAQLQATDHRLAEIVNRMTEACFALDREWRFTFINERCQTLFPHPREEMLGHSIWDLFHQLAGTQLEAHCRRVIAERAPVSFEEFFPVAERWMDIRLFPTSGGLAALLLDIHSRKLADDALRQSEERYRTLFATLIEGFCVIEMVFDAQGSPVDYRFLEVNAAFEKQTGLHDAQGKLMRDLAPDHETHWFDIYGKIALTGESARFVNEARALDRWYDVSAFRLGGPESRKVAIFFNDITEFKRAEAELLESERCERERAAELKALLDAVPTPVLIAHDADCIHITGNREADELLKIPRGSEASLSASEEIRPRNFRGVKDGRDLSTEELPAQRAARGFPVQDFEFSIVFDDGTSCHVLAYATTLRNDEGEPRGAVLVLIDISERKRMEEELRSKTAFLEAQVNSSIDAILVLDRHGEKLLQNRQAIELLKIPMHIADEKKAESVIQWVISRVKHSEKCPERLAWLNSHPEVIIHDELELKDGTVFDRYSAPVAGKDGNCYGRIWTFRDITKRKQAEKKVAEALQKEVVLRREIYHRVKNNLQVINSMLFLQSATVTDPNARSLLKESQARVRSIALVHEMLYQRQAMKKIDFGDYVRQLAADLLISYCASQRKVALKIGSDGISLDLNTAIPCGIIVNELITNALKYAFPDGENGEIEIDLRPGEQSGKLTLTVQDNGVGLPRDLDLEHTKTLGLSLVRDLTRQLEGTVEIRNQPSGQGTVAKITFREPDSTGGIKSG